MTLTNTIAPLTVDHVQAAADVLEAALGAGYITPDGLARHVGDPRRPAFVATDAGHVLGAITADLADGPDELLGNVPPDMRPRVLDVATELARAERPALLRSVAVAPAARGRGVATCLVRRTVAELCVAEADAILSVGWTDHDGCHVEGPLTAAGFTARGDLPDYWASDSAAQGYSCPTCGRPCRCSARIFVHAGGGAPTSWGGTLHSSARGACHQGRARPCT